MDWVGLAHDRERWQVFENSIMNLVGNFLTR
jgi:hypothetical protein